jgi:hypothetical protein
VHGRNTSARARTNLFSCLEVEPAEDARPEVQATAIRVRVPPPDDESQCGKIESFTAKEQSNT